MLVSPKSSLDNAFAARDIPASAEIPTDDVATAQELVDSLEKSVAERAIEEAKKPVNVTNFFQNEEGKRTEAEQRMIAESNAKPPPKPKTVPEMAAAIVHVLAKYRLPHKDNPNSWPARALFETQVEKFVARGEQVQMVLPAFPFKSPNKKTKVLGTLPDAGEEAALCHLNGLALAIKDVYQHGAKVIIVSDGLMYNDILGVSEEEVWAYGQALRRMAQDLKLEHLGFVHLRDLATSESADKAPLSEASYTNNAQVFREEVLKHLPANFDVEKQYTSDPDMNMTYQCYIKFLETDLATQHEHLSKTEIKKNNEVIAKKMLVRGKAFAGAIASRYSDCVRLSIHPSREVNKLSLAVTAQLGRVQTPWHSSVVRAVDGTFTMAHSASVSALTHDLIYENGRPMYFRERSDLFNWPGMDVVFKYQYPTGIMITPREPGASYSLRSVDMQKLRALSIQTSPVILRGFKDTTDDNVYTAKAYEAGEPAGWKFGIKTAVKDSRGSNDDPVTAIVTSSEAMPMHFDGFFFLVPKKQPDGTIRNESSQPHFQYFSAITTATPGSGYTLFANSQHLFRYFPQPHTVKDIEDMTWDCRHSSNWDEHMKNMPLVRKHPETGEPCLRYHEPWPQWKTKFTYNRISIEGSAEDQKWIDVIDELLYDRRVCFYFEWEQGDVLISDNIKMLHTRTGFSSTEDRELWRIHFN